MYLKGGVFFISPRILVVDLLTSKLPSHLVTMFRDNIFQEKKNFFRIRKLLSLTFQIFHYSNYQTILLKNDRLEESWFVMRITLRNLMAPGSLYANTENWIKKDSSRLFLTILNHWSQSLERQKDWWNGCILPSWSSSQDSIQWWWQIWTKTYHRS